MKLALIGAGGKIGARIVRNLKTTDWDCRYVEVSDIGIARLAEWGVSVTPADAALADADVAILAVPDTRLGAVSRDVVAQLPPGALLLALDPAAPLAGEIARRDGIAFGIAHPCHPSVFRWEPTEADFRDFYGGVSAGQGAVAALVDGPESVYATIEAVARTIFAPVTEVHRLTLPQMALLEPALVETLAQTCMEVIREGLDAVVARGVPAAAARDFLLGHLRIQSAILFEETPGRFSDAAYKISARARSVVFRDDWERIFTDEDVAEQVRVIVAQEPAA